MSDIQDTFNPASGDFELANVGVLQRLRLYSYIGSSYIFRDLAAFDSTASPA